MRNNSFAYILIMVDRNIHLLERTLTSIWEQTYNQSRIRILIIDNASEMAVYQKLIEYECKYPQMISVLREKKPTTRGRLLKHMIHHLRFSDVEGSIIMEPGDVIYPDFLEKSMTLLKLSDKRCIICEADVWDGENVIRQKPIYTDNCVLNYLCRRNGFTDGCGHLIQVLFRQLPISDNIKLPYYSVVAESREWFTQIYFLQSERIYLKSSLGCVYKEKQKDVISTLIKRAFFMKREFYAIETGVFSTMRAEDKEEQEIRDGYHCLATIALQFAVEKLKEEDYKQAEDCLIYAEMMYLNIAEDDTYRAIQIAIQNRQATTEGLEQMLQQESVEPPRESIAF